LEAKNGDVPDGAWPAGTGPLGIDIYICRATTETNLQIGYVYNITSTNERGCVINQQPEQAKVLSNYEVFTQILQKPERIGWFKTTGLPQDPVAGGYNCDVIPPTGDVTYIGRTQPKPKQTPIPAGEQYPGEFHKNPQPSKFYFGYWKNQQSYEETEYEALITIKN